MNDPRNLKLTLSALLGFGGGCVIILLPVFGSKIFHTPSFGGFWVLVVIAAALVGEAWALVLATRMHRSFDEFQQERAKSAWYWGGSIGLAITFPISLFVVNGGLGLVSPVLSISRPLIIAFAFGFLLPCVGLAAGYFGARLWYGGNKAERPFSRT